MRKRLLQLCLLNFSLILAMQATAQLNADFAIDKTGGCSPLTVKFTNLSSGTNSATTYTWDLGNGNTSVLQNPSAIYTAAAVYNVTLTVRNGSQTASRTKTVTVYKNPTADFSTPAPKICLPNGVTFNATATAGDGFVSSYHWNFGNGSTQQTGNSSVTHFYTQPQTPAVTLTVTNSFGCTGSITKTNLVEILPAMNAAFSINKTLICNTADSFQLTNSSTGPGTLSYLWDFGDGTTSNALNPVKRYTAKGLYQIRLTVTNQHGCSVTSSAQQVNVGYFNTNFTATPLCREVGFSGSSFLFPSSSAWQFGDGNTATGNFGIRNLYATAGTYNVTLINTYGTCKDTVTKPVTVVDNQSFNTAINMPAATCLNQTVQMQSTSSTPPSSSVWNFGDGTTQGFGSFASKLYVQPGTYTVTLRSTYGSCTETATKTITVHDVPRTNGFLVDSFGVCGAPVSIRFTDTTAGVVAWTWQRDFFNIFSTQQTNLTPFNSNGSYNITLTVSNALGCSTTVSKRVDVYAPNVSITQRTTSSPRGNYDCDSLRLGLGVSSNVNIVTYNWDFGNGTTSNAANPEIFYNQIGSYTIRLNYVTDRGCTGVVTFPARVYGKPKAGFVYSVPCGNNALNLSFSDTSFFSDRWEWAFGNGLGQGFSRSTSFSFPDTGRYSVQLITHIGRCSDTVRRTIYANVLPSSIQIIKAENTCSGRRDRVVFDQRSLRASGGTWDFGDGTIIPFDSSQHNISHTYNSTGTYTVRISTSYNGCPLFTQVTVNVLLKQSPQLTLNPLTLCAGNQLNYQVGGLQNNPFTLASPTWGQYALTNFILPNGQPAGISIYSSNVSNNVYTGYLTNFPPGNYTLRAVLNPYGTFCSDTSNAVVIQVNGPRAGFRVRNTACFKTPVLFEDTSATATAAPIISWRWEMGDGTIYNHSTNTPVQHRYANPGSYFVRLTVADNTGCNSTSSQQIVVSGARAAFNPSGMFLPDVPLNTTINFFNNTFSVSNSPVNYNWNYGNGNTANTYNGVQTYTQAGTYTVSLIASTNGCNDTAKYTINVADFNTAFRFSRSFLGQNNCLPALVRINNLSVGFTNVVWDFGDGSTSTQIYPSHVYTRPGKYRITLTTYGYNGLTGTYIDSVTFTQPLVQISADALKGCVSKNVLLTAAAQQAVSYSWDMGDGVVQNGLTSIPYPYNFPGVYKPRIIVKDSNGCPASAVLPEPIVIDSVSINVGPLPAVICDSALIQFAPAVYSFATTAIGTPLTFHWNFGTGNAADTSNLQNPSFRFPAPGVYAVHFRASSVYGCVKDTSAFVFVRQSPKAAINGLNEVCEQTGLVLTASSSPADSVQWNWSFGNGNTSTATNPPAQVYNPGSYTIRLVANRNSCYDTVDLPITVHAKPVVNAQPKQSVLCRGDSLQLQAGGGGQYLWSPAAELSNATTPNPKAAPVSNTVYRVQVTSNKGCVNTDSISIRVAQPVQVQLPAAADVCSGNTLQLQASGAASYQWIENTTGLSNTAIANPVARPATTLTYTVVGSDADNCFNDTARMVVNVRTLPTVNAGPDVQVQSGVPHQFNPVGSANVTNWLWSPAERLSCTTCPSPTLSPRNPMAYVVQVRNQYGCVAADTIQVKMLCGQEWVFVPNTFTPNRDGLNDVFYIKGSGVSNIRYLRIYDRSGQLMFERNNATIDDRSAGWDGRFKGEAVGTGTYVYLALLECGGGNTFLMKGTVTVVR
jgi:gliding motility-associated-like protein